MTLSRRFAHTVVTILYLGFAKSASTWEKMREKGPMAFEDVGAVPRERPWRPDVCPECGAETITQAPRGLWPLELFLVGSGILVVLFVIGSLAGGGRHIAPLLASGLVLVGIPAWVVRLNHRYRGRCYLRKGYAICTACQWGACDREQGHAISRMWHAAITAHRWLLVLLCPVLAWLYFLNFLEMEVRPRVVLIIGFLFAVNGVVASMRCFLPAGKPVWWRPRSHASSGGRER